MFGFRSTFGVRTSKSCVPFTIWVRLIVWFVVGMVVYIGYGVRRSKLAQPPPRA